MEETFNDILKDKKVRLVRADSGFYSDKFLQWFEKHSLNYVIAVKFYENIKYSIGSITQGVKINDEIDVCNIYFKPDNADNKRRYLIARKQTESYPKSDGKLLFEEPTYRYSVFVTNLTLPIDQIYNIYNTCDDCKNGIKELKHDFGANNFCLKELYVAEASFRFIMMAYNIMPLFKHQVLQSPM